MGFHWSLLITICLLLALPRSLRFEEDSSESISLKELEGEEDDALLYREKRQADNSDLVIKKKFPMKTNKQITGFTEEEKQNMVHIHNAYRSLVRPLASDMLEVSWDDDIADFAQEWANNCTATHRPNRNLAPWIGMGENLYWWYSGSYNEATAVKWWWDEVEFYNIRNKSCVPDEVCGHYVTEVWAKTEKIGCGVNRCARLWDLPDYGRGAYYFVCSYSGRFLSNTKPYKATDYPCSSCHRTKFPKCRYNLCVTQDMIDKDIGYNGSTEITGLYRSFTRTHPKTVTTTPIPTTTEKTTTTTTLPTTTITTLATTTTTTTEPTTPTSTITTLATTTTTATEPTTLTTTIPSTTETTPPTTMSSTFSTSWLSSSSSSSPTSSSSWPPSSSPLSSSNFPTSPSTSPTILEGTSTSTAALTIDDTTSDSTPIMTTTETLPTIESTTKNPLVHINGPLNAKSPNSFSVPLLVILCICASNIKFFI